MEPLETRRLLSVTFGTNIIANPGAENYDGTADGFNIILPKNWTANGDPTVAQYDRGYGAEIGIRKPNNAGNAFFTGGRDTENTDFFQLIDLSSIATAVDGGHVNFALSAQLGGDGFNTDNATVFVTFENAARNELARPSTGSVSASDRDHVTKFITRTTGGNVPATTRFAQVQIHFKRDSIGGYNNAFADNLALVLFTNTASTSGITPTFVKSTLPPTVVSGSKFRSSLLFTLTNTSSSPNRGVDSITLFATANGVVDSDSIAVATIKRGLGFGPLKSARFVFPVTNLSIPAGTYTLLAQTTDRYLTVVTATTGPTVVVATPVITLSATIGAVAPASVRAGRVISFLFTIQDAGNVNSTGPASFAIGLSTDGTASSAPLGTTLLKRLTIKAGAAPRAFRLRLRVPALQSAGLYTPFAIFTQGANSTTVVGAIPFTVF